MSQVREYLKIMAMILIITTLSGCISKEAMEEVSYDQNQMKKLAFDALTPAQQKTLVVDARDFQTIQKEGMAVLEMVYEENADTVEDIWAYAECQEVITRSLKDIAWVDQATKEAYMTKKNKDHVALKVQMDTNNFMLGPVVVYIDPVEEVVLGYGIRF